MRIQATMFPSLFVGVVFASGLAAGSEPADAKVGQIGLVRTDR